MPSKPSAHSKRMSSLKKWDSRKAAKKPKPSAKYKSMSNDSATRKVDKAVTAEQTKRMAASKDKTVAQKRKRATASSKAPTKSKPAKTARFGVGTSKTITSKGKKMANVTAEQLKKTGLSLRAYMNKWNKDGKRPS